MNNKPTTNSMDFCAWCTGPEEAARLTAQGKTGGICPECRRRYLMELRKAKSNLKI